MAAERQGPAPALSGRGEEVEKRGLEEGFKVDREKVSALAVSAVRLTIEMDVKIMVSRAHTSSTPHIQTCPFLLRVFCSEGRHHR